MDPVGISQHVANCERKIIGGGYKRIVKVRGIFSVILRNFPSGVYLGPGCPSFFWGSVLHICQVCHPKKVGRHPGSR